MTMFEVTYTIEALDGTTQIFKRKFHDSDIATSEVTFQPGMTLTTGAKIISAKMKKVQK